MRDFAEIGMVDLRGRRNYPCQLRPEENYSCEQGYQASCPFKGTIACPSSEAEIRAATSMLVVTNYDKWTSAKKFGRGLEHIKRVVFDEGHETPNALGRALQFHIHDRERETYIGLDPPSDYENMVEWKYWGVSARAYIEEALATALESIRGIVDPPPAKVRHALHMRNLYRKLGTLATCNPDNWVVEAQDKAFQFDPVRPGRYAESHLFLRVPDVLIVSATLRPKTLYLVGQGANTFEFKEFRSDFNPQRNPIYYVPTMRVDSRSEDLSQLWIRLDQIAARRRDRKGIVHTVSYARRDEVLTRSSYAGSMLVNERGEAPTEIIQLFKESGPGTILVSPAVGQGHDFPGSACEWQLLCKIPFPPPSAILKRRTEDDKEYPHYLTMQKMVQIFGRGMRSQDDQCENFIVDDHCEWFVPRYAHLAPHSFRMFFQTVTRLPAPPPAL
jgi:Rad3-related DNA helicase